MGKSFANFMCKKFFHPSSFANIKRVWLAEQRVKEETQKQDNLRSEYERDQDHYNNRQLMGDERVKHGLTFIYEAPKAYQKESEKSTDGKLEWKRPIAAKDATPSGSSQDDTGIVRNVRCVKCNEMGHIPTDRECPLYKSSEPDKPSSGATNQDQLVEDMRRDGYAFKQSVLGRSIEDTNFSRDLVGDDDSDDGPPDEEAFLNSLTKKQKKKLLKKLNRMERKHSGSIHKKTSHKKRRHEESSSSEDESKRRHKKHKKQRKVEESDDDSSSEESSDERHHHHRKEKKRQNGGERDAHMRDRKRRQDSSSDDEVRVRGSKMHDSHHRNRQRSHVEIKRERRYDDDESERSRKAQRGRDDYGRDDDHQQRRSKHGDRSYYKDRESKSRKSERM